MPTFYYFYFLGYFNPFHSIVFFRQKTISILNKDRHFFIAMRSLVVIFFILILRTQIKFFILSFCNTIFHFHFYSTALYFKFYLIFISILGTFFDFIALNFLQMQLKRHAFSLMNIWIIDISIINLLIT